MTDNADYIDELLKTFPEFTDEQIKVIRNSHRDGLEALYKELPEELLERLQTWLWERREKEIRITTLHPMYMDNAPFNSINFTHTLRDYETIGDESRQIAQSILSEAEVRFLEIPDRPGHLQIQIKDQLPVEIAIPPNKGLQSFDDLKFVDEQYPTKNWANDRRLAILRDTRSPSIHPVLREMTEDEKALQTSLWRQTLANIDNPPTQEERRARIRAIRLPYGQQLTDEEIDMWLDLKPGRFASKYTLPEADLRYLLTTLNFSPEEIDRICEHTYRNDPPTNEGE